MRLIQKWLKAGILEGDGSVLNPTTGTPQGGIVSPVLVNIYLHYALDLWVERVVAKRCEGQVVYQRYAALLSLKVWLQGARSKPLKELAATLRSKLHGQFNYYGVIGKMGEPPCFLGKLPGWAKPVYQRPYL